MDDPHISSETLRTDLFKEFGVDDGLRIYRSVMSCTDRLTYAQFRLRHLSKVINEQVAPHFEVWQETYNVDEPEGVFNQSQWEIRMLATEAVHHLHSVFDPLACAIYWFNVPVAQQKLPPRDVTFYKVRTCEQISLSYRELMKDISSTGSFFHLAALSNSAKHSGVVRSPFSHERNGGHPLTAEEAILFESCEGPNPLSGEPNPTRLHKFPETPISIYLKSEVQRVAPIFNKLVGLLRSDLTLRLNEHKP